jgi:hypothetical protein
MKRLSRLPSLFTSIFLVGACQQIIGLGDYESVDEEEGGGGGKGGSGGAVGGTGGKGGKGGNAGTSTGGTGGKGGTAGRGGTGGKGGTSGEAGEGGMGAEGGTGGANAGRGGAGGAGGSGGTSGNGGTAGSGGKSACPDLVLQEVVGMTVDRSSASFLNSVFDVAIQQQLVGSAEDFVGVQFYAGDAYDGQLTGSFELGTGIDDNYETCGRCVLVERDAGALGSAGNTRFFATSGTIDIEEESLQIEGRPSLTLTDVTLVEVTIDSSTFVSTPVAGGDCYHIPSYTMELPVAAYSCPVDTWGDNLCDCGCGEPDLECLSPLVGACDTCTSAGSCAQTDCLEIDFDDNSQCAASNPTWTCPLTTFGDGDCNCGCGSVDPDCTSDYVGACDYCDDTGSCDGSTDCIGIALDDNGACIQGAPTWTCTPGFYGAVDGCDCGCGVVDPDCSDQTEFDTCFCGTGSCSSADDCASVDPSNNSQCI